MSLQNSSVPKGRLNQTLTIIFQPSLRDWFAVRQHPALKRGAIFAVSLRDQDSSRYFFNRKKTVRRPGGAGV